MYIYPCMYIYPRAEESFDFIEAHCGLPSREKPYEIVYICTCVFLIYDILEYVYHSACDNKFSVQLDPYLVQRKYISRIYVSKLITTQSSSPCKVVLVSTSMVIVIITDTACQFAAQNSHVVTCVQIFYAWKLGDFMNRLD